MRITSFLIMAWLGTACGGSGGLFGGNADCDTDGPNLPVGGATNSDYLYNCEFTTNTTWFSETLHQTRRFEGGDSETNTIWGYTCGQKFDAQPACFQICIKAAEDFGVADTYAACKDVVALEELTYAGSCPFLQRCEPGEEPKPDPAYVEPKFYCIADLSRFPEQDECLTPTGGVWGRNDEGRCRSNGPTTNCGFPVWDEWPGDDPDQQCKDLCPALFLQGDEAENNCNTFVRAEICYSNAEPGRGNDFSWQTATGTTKSPLACDGACCGKFGAATCANLGARRIIAPVATRRVPLSLPVRFESRGVVSTGMMFGMAAISVARCPAGKTCPIYLESLELNASVLSGTWVGPAGIRRPITLTSVGVKNTRPVIGGYRSDTGELQIGVGSTDFDVRANVDATSLGMPHKSRHFIATTTRAITGHLSGAKLSLATSIDLKDGSRLVIGTP